MTPHVNIFPHQFFFIKDFKGWLPTELQIVYGTTKDILWHYFSKIEHQSVFGVDIHPAAKIKVA